MRRIPSLLAVAALAATGLVVVAAGNPAMASQDVVDCPSNGENPDAVVGEPVDSPAVVVEDVPVLDKVGAGEGQTCAELVRTLVFIGHADIDNGVNAAGVGGTVDIDGGDQYCGRTEDGELIPASDWQDVNGDGTIDDADENEYGQKVGLCDESDNGGNFKFGGECILVNWDNPDQSGITGVNDCAFTPTFGFYTRPNFHGSAGGGTGGLFGCIEDGPGAPDAHEMCQGGGTPGETGLAFVPPSQASCTASDGRGTSTFVAANGNDVWSSQYTWNDSLNNLRGSIWQGNPGDRGSATNYVFDAKVQTQADPRMDTDTLLAQPTDTTAAGCLEKTLQTLSPVGESVASTGLNSVLVVGTASWRVENAPEIYA